MPRTKNPSNFPREVHSEDIVPDLGQSSRAVFDRVATENTRNGAARGRGRSKSTKKNAAADVDHNVGAEAGNDAVNTNQRQKRSASKQKKVAFSSEVVAGVSTEEQNIAVETNRRACNDSLTRSVDTYGFPNKLHRLLELLTPKQKEDIQEIGFGGLLTLKLNSYYQGMVPFLVDAYNGGSRRFYVDATRECFLTPYDVHDVFLLPCDTGNKVKVATQKKSDSNYLALVQRWKDKFEVPKYKELSAEVIANEIHKLPNGGDDFKRYFVLYAMGTLLAPGAHKNVDLHLVPSVENVNEISQLDWCSYILEEIDDGVKKWRKNASKHVGGCILFLQLVYFHRLSWKSEKTPTEIPLIQHWNSENLRRRIVEEKKVADAPGGKYGMGEWDTTTYPISRRATIVTPALTGSFRSESLPLSSMSYLIYKIPSDLPTNEQIRQQAKNVCEEDGMLIKRDNEIHSRLTAERLARVKRNAQILSQATTNQREGADANVDDEEQMTLTQALNDPAVLQEIDSWVDNVKRVSETASDMPSFDLGINDIGRPKPKNIGEPRYFTRHSKKQKP